MANLYFKAPRLDLNRIGKEVWMVQRFAANINGENRETCKMIPIEVNFFSYSLIKATYLWSTAILVKLQSTL